MTGQARQAEYKIGLLAVLGDHARGLGRTRRREAAVAHRGGLGRPAEPVTEGPADAGHGAPVLHRAGDGHHHPRRLVAPPVVAGHLGPPQCSDRGHRAEDRAPERRVAEQCGGELVEDKVGRLVVAHGDLFEDHGAFDVHVLLADRRVEHDIGDDIDGQRQVAVKHGGVEAGVLLLRERVELTTDGVDRRGDVQSAASRGALEEQMLEIVAGAGHRGRLIGGTHAHPDTDARTARPGHGLGDDPQPARQHRLGDQPAAGRGQPRGPRDDGHSRSGVTSTPGTLQRGAQASADCIMRRT